MKAGDLVRVTTECFATDFIDDIGIITAVRAFSDCKTVLEVKVLFYSGTYCMDPLDLEVISENYR